MWRGTAVPCRAAGEEGSPATGVIISPLRDAAPTAAFLDSLGWNVNIKSQLIKELLISLIIN